MRARISKWLKITGLVILIIVIVSVGLFLFIGSRGGLPGQYAVTDGVNTDYLNTSEGILIGTKILYTCNAHDMGFCTSDPEILDAARKFATRSLYVAIEYRSINAGDTSSFGCDPGDDKITVYHITKFYLTIQGARENLELEAAMGYPHDPFYDAPPQ